MFKFIENGIKKYEEVIPPWGPVGDSELLDEECDSGMCPIR